MAVRMGDFDKAAEVLHGNPFTACQRAVLSHKQHFGKFGYHLVRKFFFVQNILKKLIVAHRIAHYSHFVVVVGDVGYYAAGSGFVVINVEPVFSAQLPGKLRKGVRDIAGARSGHGKNDFLALAAAHLFFHFVYFAQYFFSGFYQQFAVGGEFDAFGIAVENGDTQLFFEFLYSAGQIGLRNI